VSTANAIDDAAHLARLLDQQPSCLMRIGIDSMLLAVNDASLGLLGAEKLEQVLGTRLLDRLVPEHHELWRDFAARVWSAGSASIECDMLDSTETRRSVDLQGVALPDHPDGIRSLLVVARDITSTRALESALQEHEATRRAAEQLRADLAEANQARDHAQNSLSARDADQQRVALAMDALREELERSLGEARRLAEELAQQTISQQRLQDLVRERETECRNLQSAIERYESDQQRLESELEQSASEREQFESMVKQREATRQRTLAEHATARMHFERALAGATSRGQRLAQALTDQSAELQSMGKHLESLAKQLTEPEAEGTE
jgi:hypothetical protein